MTEKTTSISQGIEPSRYIPLSCHQIVTALSAIEADGHLHHQWQHFFKQVRYFYHHQSYQQLEDLKLAFHSLSTHSVSDKTAFKTLLDQLLDQANYTQLTTADVEQAFGENALFKIKLEVDFSQFADCLVFIRGAEAKEEQVSSFLGLRKRTVEFVNYQRVMIYIRYRDDVDDLADDRLKEDVDDNGIMLKLFKNVPKNDLEILFPNTRIRMRLIDKLLIGVPAVISGGIVLSTKLGATLILLGSLLGFWLGMSAEPVELDNKAIVVLLAGFGALGSYLWKQFSNFKNRKLLFAQRLTQNLYFKNLDNDAGVFHRIIDEAQEAECKEVILAYYCLHQAATALTAKELDQRVESWLQQQWSVNSDFEIDDALNKLQALGLVRVDGDKFTALALTDIPEVLAT